ncbi:MAG: DegT/DnrJ/EryC1/StrS family aminotransferase [Steroidobacteraceae bacterium]
MMMPSPRRTWVQRCVRRARSRAAGHIYNQYVIRARNRDSLRQRLSELKIGSEIYYPVPLHRQQCFAYLGYGAGAFPHSEAAAAQTVALPIYPELVPEQLLYVVDSIAQFYA